MSAEVVMARRDASWYNHPNVHVRSVYHVATEKMQPACNNRALLSEFTSSSVEAVPYGMRCHRAACRKRWLAAGGTER